MTASQIREVIQAEIDGDWDRTNAHGVDLGDSLTEPYKRTFRGEWGEARFELWVVLEEHPEEEEGYLIVYDEDADTFGLAVHENEDHPTYIGRYGDFMEAFTGM